MANKIGGDLTGSLLTDFVTGVRKGVNVNFNVMIPNFIMAFIIIYVLNITGLTNFLSYFLSPVMGIFGLDGSHAAILVVGWLSSSGMVGALAAMVSDGAITGREIAIVMPMCYMFSGQLQMLGRILAVTKIPTKYYAPIFIISFINAAIVGIAMNLITMAIK